MKVLGIPHRIVDSLSGKGALWSWEGEVVYQVEEVDLCSV